MIRARWPYGPLDFSIRSLRESAPAPRMTFEFECRDSNGNLKWRERVENIVTTVGKTFAVDVLVKGVAYTASWFMLLAGAGAKAVGDTLASHAAWTEITAYTGNRPAIVWGTSAAGSNTATGVAFAITGTVTVAGAGVCDVATTNSGTLYNVADFAVARSMASGDTLTVTPTLTFT